MFLVLSLALLAELGSICETEMNPPSHDVDVSMAVLKTAEEFDLWSTDLRAVQISRCDDETVVVWVINSNGSGDLLKPWIARRVKGAWSVERQRDG